MKHRIDLDLIKDIAYKGVRRTSAFLGLGLNASEKDSFNEYQLTDITQIQLLPDNLNESAVNQFKSEFRKWIISNGIRELIETFSVFLDSIHKVLIMIDAKVNHVERNEFEKVHMSYKMKGLSKKLEYLNTKFSINSSFGKYLISINKARNCFSHRQGIVGEEDLFGCDKFDVIWLGIDLFIETNDGKILQLKPPMKSQGIFVEKGGEIKIKREERQRDFNLGEELEFNSRDISEMCMLVLWATDDIIKLTLNYAKTQGIAVEDKSE